MRNPKGLVPLWEILWRFEPVFVTENVRACKPILGSQRNPLDKCGRAFIDELAVKSPTTCLHSISRQTDQPEPRPNPTGSIR